jgi:hypothetical protein
LESAAQGLSTAPSLSVRNADGTRVGASKKEQGPLVIVSVRTHLKTCITVAQTCDDAQLALLTAISAFGDSIPPLFISKSKSFEKQADQQLFEHRNYTIRTAPKNFMTEVLFIDWSENVFLQ